MDELRETINKLLLKVRSNKKLNDIDKKRIAEKIIWIEREIIIYSNEPASVVGIPVPEKE